MRLPLPTAGTARGKAAAPRLDASGGSGAVALKAALQSFERRHITDILERCGWNRTRTAAALGLGRKTLYLKMKQLGIDARSVSVLNITQAGKK